jgi:GTP cyclohydrolase II
LIYLTDQEGRGHGLKWKVRALKHKNDGLDTFTAVERLGLDPDIRDYKVVPAILEELGVRSVALLTNNPDKRQRIIDAGTEVAETHALEVCPPIQAWRHMEAKRRRGHDLTNAYMDTGEIPVVTRWMPAVTARMVPRPPSASDTIVG